MTNEEQDILYNKLMKILILLEDGNVSDAKMYLASLTEYIKFKKLK
jgi:hypothetical protein